MKKKAPAPPNTSTNTAAKIMISIFLLFGGALAVSGFSDTVNPQTLGNG
jgi:hypothetical protein